MVVMSVCLAFCTMLYMRFEQSLGFLTEGRQHQAASERLAANAPTLEAPASAGDSSHVRHHAMVMHQTVSRLQTDLDKATKRERVSRSLRAACRMPTRRALHLLALPKSMVFLIWS